MRRSKQDAAETRRQIVEAAATEFRRGGVAATGLDHVMAAAGLSHGGFYRHFDSKDQLIAEACAAAADTVVAEMQAAIGARQGQAGLKAAAENYLSPRHRDEPSSGCPFAALGPEMARAEPATRSAATQGMERLIGVLADQYGGERQAAEDQAMVMLSTLVGAVILSRIADTPALSDRLLDQARQHLIPT